jgi:16S rRNA (cytosine1402-N4)-methyltransferase
MNEQAYHRPVLLRESVEGLAVKPDGVYVDVTFGGGGHSREILKLLENGRLIAFDQDPAAKRNVPDDPRFTLVDQNFRNLTNWLRFLNIRAVDGVLADLGVSSHQFDSGDRGFSIRFNGPLDMRMDLSQKRSAASVINESTLEDLIRILLKYGEVHPASRTARKLIESRPINSTGELMEAIRPLAPKGKEHKFFAQVFQALRIEVNDELTALQDLLNQTEQVIAPGGRLVVISYHSLEDRMVKDYMRTGNTSGEQVKDFFGNLIRPFRPVTTKPIVPTDEEISNNNRARSARLRIAERISK